MSKLYAVEEEIKYVKQFRSELRELIDLCDVGIASVHTLRRGLIESIDEYYMRLASLYDGLSHVVGSPSLDELDRVREMRVDSDSDYVGLGVMLDVADSWSMGKVTNLFTKRDEIIFESGSYQTEPEAREDVETLKKFADSLLGMYLNPSRLISDSSMVSEFQRVIREYFTSFDSNDKSVILRNVYYGCTPEKMADGIYEYVNYRLAEFDAIEEDERRKEMNEQITCACCGEVIDYADSYDTVDGRVCEHCRNESYEECADCERVVHYEDSVWVDAEEHSLCRDCWDRTYTTCTHCGEQIRLSDAAENENGDYYCQSCYDDRYTTCDGCGCEIDVEDACFDEDSDGYFCEECYEERQRNKVVKGYHAEVDYEKKVFLEDENDRSVLFLGIEHEVLGSYDCLEHAKEFLNIVNPNYSEENCFLMYDGSIGSNGFEIITQPMSVNYFKYTFLPLYRKGLEYLKNEGFKGEDVGGIHIHFNAIEDTKQVARLCNILYGSTDDIDSWCDITGRKRSELDHWCSMNRRYSTAQILEYDYKSADEARYTALNYDGCRTNTHEIRIFNSTVDADRYATCVEIVVSLLDYTSVDRGKGCYTTTRDWMEYIEENKDVYPLVFQRLVWTLLFDKYEIEVVPPLSQSEKDMIDEICDKLTEDTIDSWAEARHRRYMSEMQAVG